MLLRTRKAVALIGTLALLGGVSVLMQPTAGASGSPRNESGGRAVVHHGGGAPINSSGANIPYAHLYRIGVNAAEPTLGTTKDGDIFVTALQGNTKVDVVRSTDQGQTWKIVSPKLPGGKNAQAISLDPYLYVDHRTNRVFTIDNTVACLYMSYSDDRGGSWTTNPAMCSHPDVNDHQTIAAGPPSISPTVGYPDVIYYCYNDVVTTSCAKSLDGGINWVSTGQPPFPGVDPNSTSYDYYGVPGVCDGLSGHVYVGHDGTVYMPRGWCGHPYVAISHDEGATWKDVKVSNMGISGHEGVIAEDGAGNLYYMWIDNLTRLPFVSVSTDGGTKWGKPVEVAAPGVKETDLPTLEVGAPGHLAIAYVGSTNAPGAPYKTDSSDAAKYTNVTWNAYLSESVDMLSKNPTFYTATVNNPRDPILRRTCGPDRCGPEYDFIDVDIAPDGTAWAAYVDGCIGACATTKGAGDNSSEGIVGHLAGGPSLWTKQVHDYATVVKKN
ncbi:MAG: hypothetical protein QOF16_1830 [Actinomycetota bacterium]|nr:hypothetical protein [Actinomycetota bacterium]